MQPKSITNYNVNIKTSPKWLTYLSAASNICLRTASLRSPSAVGTKKWNSVSSNLAGTDVAIFSRASPTPCLASQLSTKGADATRPRLSTTGGGICNKQAYK